MYVTHVTPLTPHEEGFRCPLTRFSCPSACRCVLDVAPLRMLPAFFAVLEALPPIPPEDSPMQVLAGGGEGEGWRGRRREE